MSIPSEDLKKLKELFDAGILTKDEFEAKKRQLLGLFEKPDSTTQNDSSTHGEKKQDVAQSEQGHEGRIDIEQLADIIAENVSEPYDDTGFINDDDYGVAPAKPIAVAGLNEELKYLDKINGFLLKKIEWNRTSSITVDEVNGTIDIYEGLLDGEKPITLYINPYGLVSSPVIPKAINEIKKNIESASVDKKQYEVFKNVIDAVQGSEYSNSDYDHWDKNLEVACKGVDSICPAYNVLWNNLKNYHSKKAGILMDGVLIPFSFSDILKVQMLHRIALGFSMLLYAFYERTGRHKELIDFYKVTAPYVFWRGNSTEELLATVNNNLRQEMSVNNSDYEHIDTRAGSNSEWVKNNVSDSLITELLDSTLGSGLLILGNQLVNISEEKKTIKSGFLGMNTKTEQIPDPQLRNDIATYLSISIPIIEEAITPFTKID